MGFESSRATRRRLAVLAMSNERISAALAPSQFHGHSGKDEDDVDSRSTSSTEARRPEIGAALADQLEQLAKDIVATPGAGGALLAAYAAQARALTLVVEASRRATLEPLPADVMSAVHRALTAPVAVGALLGS